MHTIKIEAWIEVDKLLSPIRETSPELIVDEYATRILVTSEDWQYEVKPIGDNRISFGVSVRKKGKLEITKIEQVK